MIIFFFTVNQILLKGLYKQEYTYVGRLFLKAFLVVSDFKGPGLPTCNFNRAIFANKDVLRSNICDFSTLTMEAVGCL